MISNSFKSKSFTDLRVWQVGHSLVLDVYKVSKDFPNEEKFGLSNQLRRAVVSVTSNIAEGFGRWTKKDKANFYTLALGSLLEVQNQLIIGRDLGYLDEITFNTLFEKATQISKMLYALINKTRA